MKPFSRQTLVEYALRSLGAPVLEVNVDDDQLGDRLDEAIQIFQEYHSDAVIKRYYAYEITALDVTNRYIPIPDNFLWVTRILPFNTVAEGGDYRPEYQMLLNDFYGMRNAHNSLINYVMVQMHMALIEDIFDGLNTTIDFNRHMNQLHIFEKWGSDLKVGQIIIVEAYEAINPSDYPKVYNDMLLKKLFTALVKKQWGTNLKKFAGMQLPGGVTINGKEIYDEAIEELKDIQDDLDNRYSVPAQFFVG